MIGLKLVVVAVVVLGLGIGAILAAWQAQQGNTALSNPVGLTAPNSSSAMTVPGTNDGPSQAASRPEIGIVEKLGASEFSLKLSADAKSVTVRVDDRTSVSKQSAVPISDIKQGDRIVAQGRVEGAGILDAASVRIISPDGGLTPQIGGIRGGTGIPQRQDAPSSGGANASPGQRADVASVERFSMGQVESVDGSVITISTFAGRVPGASSSASSQSSSRIAVSDKTMITGTVAGTFEDLEVGKTVTVTGQRGPDGAIIATSVQMLPAGALEIIQPQR